MMAAAAASPAALSSVRRGIMRLGVGAVRARFAIWLSLLGQGWSGSRITAAFIVSRRHSWRLVILLCCFSRVLRVQAVTKLFICNDDSGRACITRLFSQIIRQRGEGRAILSGSIDPHYAIAGFLVGALVGVTGVGGGSLMTPILIVLFGVSPATAVGTDLLFAAATKTVGSLVHGFNRTIDWRVVRRLATGSIPTTGLALVVLSLLDIRAGGAHHIFTAFFTIAFLFM